MKPRIGITSGSGPAWAPEGAAWRSYAEAVERAGGEPVHLGSTTLGRERAVLADLQGLLFTGGRDVDLRSYPNPPELNGEEPEAVMARYRMQPEPERDAWELPLLQEALARDLPVLGVCRGCQLVAVGLGGRLVLDIPLEVRGARPHSEQPDHPLRIDPASRLARILDPERTVRCNSYHHQAVRPDCPGQVRIAAVCPEDGVVEAIEAPGRRWVFGVQWHPERAKDRTAHELSLPLFEAFLRAAA